MASNIHVPALILVLFIIDVALGLGYISNELLGRPYKKLTLFLNLDGEGNLPTWYSSIQWFCVAIFLGLFAHRNFSLRQKRSWLLVVVSLLFLALSLDEVAQIHEWLGGEVDVLLPGGTRHNTLVHDTGIWTLAIGVPFLALFIVLISSIKVYFQRAPDALFKIFLGMLIMLIGAIGLETLSNFVTPGTKYRVLQVFSEEFCELVGATMVLWGSYELLRVHGFAFWLAPCNSDGETPPRYPPSPNWQETSSAVIRSNQEQYPPVETEWRAAEPKKEGCAIKVE
jgi:hypothetical protein